jgi:hypothetical protein
LLPRIESNREAVSVVNRFREVCVQAAAQKKCAFLFCD